MSFRSRSENTCNALLGLPEAYQKIERKVVAGVVELSEHENLNRYT